MPGPFSPPHESFKGSVEEWQSLTRVQRFRINNPGRQKMLDSKSREKTKDNWKEWRDNPINKERTSEKQKQYRTDNRERRKKCRKEKRDKDSKTTKDKEKKWRDQNPDKCRAARLRCDLKKQKNFNVMFHEIY